MADIDMTIVSVDMPKFLFEGFKKSVESTSPLRVIAYPDFLQNGEVEAFMVAPSEASAVKIIKEATGDNE